MYTEPIREIIAANGINGVGEEEIAKFGELCLAVAEKNKVMNLTAVTEPRKMALLHIADCLLVSPFLPKNASVIDVGCGGGFPCLPLAILRPDLRILALDSTAKKVKFVEETAETLSLKGVSVLAARAEDTSRKAEYREKFDICLSRAVASLPVLTELCLPFVRKGGSFIAMKGEKAEEEIALAGRAPFTLGGTPFRKEKFELCDGDVRYTRFLLFSEKNKPTEKKYPRSFASISEKPLK